MFWFLGHETCGIIAPQPGIEPSPPELEGEVLTTGLPGKSQIVQVLTWRKKLALPCVSSALGGGGWGVTVD